MNTEYQNQNNSEQTVPNRNLYPLSSTTLPVINQRYIYYWMPSAFKRKGTFLMQLEDPGLSGVIFCFQHNEEDKRREFLAGVSDTRLLGKANGFRVYCIITRTRVACSPEYVEENAQRIAQEMANLHLNSFRDPVHMARFRDL